jgi:hypothetical protein
MKTATLVEPLSPKALSKISANLLSVTSEDDRVALAAILYKYGVPSGEAFMSRHLDETSDLNCAGIFAMNKREDKKAAILRSFSSAFSPTTERDPDVNPYIPDFLLEALAEWNDSKVSDALYRAFLSDQSNNYLILALGRQNRQEAVPAFKRIFARRGKEASDYAIDIAIALSLMKLGRATGNTKRYVLPSKLKSTDPVFLVTVLDNIRFLKLTETIDYVKDVLRFLRSNESKEHLWLLPMTIHCLESIDSQSAREAAAECLIQYRNGPISKTSLGYLGRVASKNPKNKKIVEEVLGSEWMQNEDKKPNSDFKVRIPSWTSTIDLESFHQVTDGVSKLQKRL